MALARVTTGTWSATVWMLLAVASARANDSTVRFTIDPSVDSALVPAVEGHVNGTWATCVSLMRRVNGGREPSGGSAAEVRIRAARRLPSGEQAHSGPGVIDARLPNPLDGATVQGLRHEVVHQFLWAACPASHDDAILHEGLAMVVSGELESWSAAATDVSRTRALRALRKDTRVRTRAGRSALAWLLHSGGTKEGVPRALYEALASCAADAYRGALRAEDLVIDGEAPGQLAFVLLSRHSGEVLEARGPVDEPLPPGSTLKPLLIAGREVRPSAVMVPPTRSPEWECGVAPGHSLTWQQALARSCNGFFLHSFSSSEGPIFARLTALLEAAGMKGSPRTAADGIGLTREARVSPRGLAQAYRTLAEWSPDVVEAMRAVPVDGTLSNAKDADWARVQRLALKTGTVRDVESRPTLGWIAAVSDDFVGVLMVPGRAPADALATLKSLWPDDTTASPWRPVSAQVFGLLMPSSLQVRCARGGVVVDGERRVVVGDDFRTWTALGSAARLTCLGPLLVRFPGLPKARPYAGILSASPVGDVRAGRSMTRSERARRGSDLVFTTTRVRYALGVLASEDATLTGAPWEALLHVVDFNARHSRHAPRPICDTTHCQVFQGTAASDATLRAATAALRSSVHTELGWLPFSKGGDVPWTQTRSLSDVESRLEQTVARISREGPLVVIWRMSQGDVTDPAFVEEPARVPCEAFRGRMQLPSCPDVVERTGQAWVFRGRGEGHGLGMDVEAARKMKGKPIEILRAFYGAGLELRAGGAVEGAR